MTRSLVLSHTSPEKIAKHTKPKRPLAVHQNKKGKAS